MKWLPIDTAPIGYDGERWTYVLFLGTGKSLNHPVVVSGWMGREMSGRPIRPIHNYRYALTITHWAPFPELPGAQRRDFNRLEPWVGTETTD